MKINVYYSKQTRNDLINKSNHTITNLYNNNNNLRTIKVITERLI